VFARLDTLLEQLDSWLDRYFAEPRNDLERDFVAQVRRYIRYCRRDPEKNRSVAAAERAVEKLEDWWMALYRMRGGRL
jgi:hypothetical protein